MFKFKVTLENDTRLFKYEGVSLSDAFEELKLFVFRVFNIENFRLQFCDEEDDLVTIVSPQDLDDALEFIKTQDKTLKIFVVPSVDEVRVEENTEVFAVNDREDDPINTTTEQREDSTTEKNDSLSDDQPWTVAQNVIELLTSDEAFRQEFAAFLQDILLQIREGDNLETSIHTSLAAHEALSLGPLQNVIPLIPFLSSKEAFLIPFLGNIDPNSVPKLVEDFVSSLQQNENGSFNLPPFLQMLHPAFGGLCNGMNMPWFHGGAGPHSHGPHHPHPHPHHPPPPGFNPFGFNHNRHHGHHRWHHKKNKKWGNKCGNKKKNFRAEIIRDDITLADKAVVLPGHSVVKTWRIQNSGKLPFPDGTQLIYIGRRMNALIDGVKFPVPPLKVDEEGEVSVLLTTPNRSGRYGCSWRLQLPDKTSFGPMFRARVVVAENDEKSSDSELDTTNASKIEMKLRKLKEKREKEIKRLESLDAKIEKLTALQNTELASSQNDLDIDLDHDDDDGDVELVDFQAQHDTFQEQLAALQNMGFINFDLNRSLLARHHGNMDDVLNALCT